jgi:MFS family permease
MMLPLLVGSNVPFVLVSIGVTDPVRQSLIIALVSIMSATSGAVFGAVQQSVGVRRTFSLSLLLAALGMAFLGLGTNWWMITAGCALSGIAVGIYIPHLYVLSTTLVPEALRGHSVGLATTSMFLGGFLYPFLVGGLQSMFGLQGAMQSIAVLLAIAASVALIARGARLAGAPYTKAA